MVSVTGVDVSRDMAHARVYFTLLGCDSEDEAKPSTEVLNRAAGFLRSSLARDASMRTVPRLRFYFDASVGRGRDLEDLISRAKQRMPVTTSLTNPTHPTEKLDVARRRRGRPVSGILLLDKPLGLSSNHALQRAKRLYNAAKAGHTGSLDPLATGVLPLCFGEATKFSQYLLDASKAYDTTVCLGMATDTGDAEGEVLQESDASALDEATLHQALEPFRGDIAQLPPMYSALKRDGQPLYKLARQGVEVERQPRDVTIYSLECLAFRPGVRAEVDLRIHCSKGTYIRSIAMDLGEALGLGGHVTALRRTAVGPFTLDGCVSLDSLQGLRDNDEFAAMDALLRPADEALAHLPLLQLPQSSGFYLRQGQPVLVPNAPCDGMVRVALETGEFLGLGEILDDGRVAPRRLVAENR